MCVLDYMTIEDVKLEVVSYNSTLCFFNIYMNREMVDSGKSDKMIKISGKVDRLTTTGLVVIFRSLFK